MPPGGASATAAASPSAPAALTAAAAATATATAAAAQQKPRGGAPNWDAARMFAAGGLAGACARTATAPLDRIKLLFQVQAVAGGPGGGVAGGALAYTGVGQAARKILREEGALAFWKGNGVNVVRVLPYSAAQLASNDAYKRFLAARSLGGGGGGKGGGEGGGGGGGGGDLSVPARLLAGACAGMTATALTHPLDTVRLRLALPSHPFRGAADAFATIARTEGFFAFYRGLAPTLVGIAPYAAINFASYDLLKRALYGDGGGQASRPGKWASSLGVGALAGTLAATACYPLDTVRRRMQMRGSPYASQADALRTIWRAEGARGFYRGWCANTIKVVPQNAIRLASYEALKSALGVQRAKTDT
jgi:solute carrier family 25 phosphate transporter 23/24/25/41